MEGHAQTLARRVQELRRAKGWSRERLALEAGLKEKTISRIEKAEVVQPQSETFDRLARALGVDVYLLDAGRPTLAELTDDGGPLQRIEDKLDRLLAALTPAVAAGPPSPPGELGRRVAKPKPTPEDHKHTANQPAAGARKRTAR